MASGISYDFGLSSSWWMLVILEASVSKVGLQGKEEMMLAAGWQTTERVTEPPALTQENSRVQIVWCVCYLSSLTT